jgi:folate-binding protein YgfZ
MSSFHGDPAGEYEAAREGAAVLDLPALGVIEASGPTRQKFLQGLLTNDVAGLRPGQGCRAALLTAKGAVQALLRVLVETDVVVLEADAERLALVLKVLEHHRVAAPVRFATRPTAVVGLLGPRAADILRAAGAEAAPDEPEGHVRATLAGRAVRLVRAGDLPGGGFVFHAAPEAAGPVREALQAAGARPIGRDVLDGRRVETLRPWWGSDVSEENLLHETGLVAELHSPTKGCYLGQEVVARLQARGGNVNKALRGLRLSVPAAANAIVTVEGEDVGRVTTAAVSPQLGPVALAYVHRNHFAPGTAVEVGGSRATVVTSFEEGEGAPPGANP